MKNQITIDPHTLDHQLQTWDLRFRHYMFTSSDSVTSRPGIKQIQRVGIILEATREGRTPAENENVLIGTASFLPGHKPEIIQLTTQPDGESFVKALLDNSLAKRIGQTIARHKDYPGADEMEEFRYHHLDITDYYNQYMEDKQKEAMDSPLSHIFLCEGPICNGVDPQFYFTCRIGGIEQPRQWVGPQGRDLFKVVGYYPDCRFHLYEMATEVFDKQLKLYHQAQQRITDPTVLFNKGTHYIRCKIDGEQQMVKEVDRLDISDYQINKDFAALAAKYYARQLENDQSIKQGLSR